MTEPIKIAVMTAPTHMPTISGVPRASTLGGEVFRINTVSSVKFYLQLTCPGGYNTSVLSAVGHFVLCWRVFSQSPIDLTTEVIAHFILPSCWNRPAYGNCFTVSVLTNDLHLVQ